MLDSVDRVAPHTFCGRSKDFRVYAALFTLKSHLARLARQYPWQPVWREAPLKPGYEVVVIGGRGHGLANCLLSCAQTRGAQRRGIGTRPDRRRELGSQYTVGAFKLLLSREVIGRSMPTNTAGFSALRRVTIGRLSNDGQSAEVLRSFRCDSLGVSGAWNATLHLYAQPGGKLGYDEAFGALQPISPH